jgi:hypothetical protein
LLTAQRLGVGVLSERCPCGTGGGCGSRPPGATTLKVGLTVEPIGATLNAVRTAYAVEAVAAEVVQQAECSGQLVTMSMIDCVLDQLRDSSADVPMRLVW